MKQSRMIATALTLTMCFIAFESTAYAASTTPLTISATDISQTTDKIVTTSGKSLPVYVKQVDGSSVYMMSVAQSDVRSAFDALNKTLDPNLAKYGINGSNSPMSLSQTRIQNTSVMAAASGTNPTNVNIWENGRVKYGNNRGYSNINSNATSYNWSNAIYQIRQDTRFSLSSWGGQSAAWFGTGMPKYIQMTENITTTGLAVSLSISTGGVGGGFSGSSQSQTRTVATANNVNILGGENAWCDAVSYMVWSVQRVDSASINVNGYTYYPTSAVYFNTQVGWEY